jgi:hypothetical protein
MKLENVYICLMSQDFLFVRQDYVLHNLFYDGKTKIFIPIIVLSYFYNYSM